MDLSEKAMNRAGDFPKAKRFFRMLREAANNGVEFEATESFLEDMEGNSSEVSGSVHHARREWDF